MSQPWLRAGTGWVPRSSAPGCVTDQLWAPGPATHSSAPCPPLGSGDNSSHRLVGLLRGYSRAWPVSATQVFPEQCFLLSFPSSRPNGKDPGDLSSGFVTAEVEFE